MAFWRRFSRRISTTVRSRDRPCQKTGEQMTSSSCGRNYRKSDNYRILASLAVWPTIRDTSFELKMKAIWSTFVSRMLETSLAVLGKLFSPLSLAHSRAHFFAFFRRLRCHRSCYRASSPLQFWLGCIFLDSLILASSAPAPGPRHRRPMVGGDVLAIHGDPCSCPSERQGDVVAGICDWR